MMRTCRLPASWVAALFAVGSYCAVASAALVPPGFYEVGASTEEGQTYGQGRMLALRLLGSANGLDESIAPIAAMAAEQLAAAKFYVSADAEGDRQCAKIVASLFVTSDFPKSIFICADTRWHVQRAPGLAEVVLAQGFIHEAVHLAGTADECKATQLELEVTANGIGAVNYGNYRRYSKQCNGLLDRYAPGNRTYRINTAFPNPSR